MKKLDIEKLQRKTPELPKHFFQEMQEKVLEKTIKKQAKPNVFRLNPMWYAAAVALLAGLGFFHLSNENLVENKTIAQQSLETKNPENTDFSQKENTNENPKITETTSSKNVSFASENIDQDTEKPTHEPSTTPKMEEVLDSMTEKELTDLATNYEQDPYLELY